MKEILKITASLTAVCVAAALILGMVFAKTEHARKEIEEGLKEQTIQSLLGFGEGKKPPADLKIYPIYRYVVKDDKGQTVLAYLLPLKDKGQVFAEIDLEGKPGKVYPVAGDAVALADQAARDNAIQAAVPKGTVITYAQTLYIANLGDKRLGYVIPGVTQGFKTFIQLMVSLDPKFTVTGIEIVKSEEDPGLGDEIKQEFFKNQFDGKTVDILKGLKVVKEPLPEDYLPALDPAKAKAAGLTEDKVKQIKEKHLKDDIYALTGATISSRAVVNGVRDTAIKFVYRLGILSNAVKQQNISVAF
jgi:Na+-translocating ferredoxin:NAD+ oxidoreductase subunit G